MNCSNRAARVKTTETTQEMEQMQIQSFSISKNSNTIWPATCRLITRGQRPKYINAQDKALKLLRTNLNYQIFLM